MCEHLTTLLYLSVSRQQTPLSQIFSWKGFPTYPLCNRQVKGHKRRFHGTNVHVVIFISVINTGISVLSLKKLLIFKILWISFIHFSNTNCLPCYILITFGLHACLSDQIMESVRTAQRTLHVTTVTMVTTREWPTDRHTLAWPCAHGQILTAFGKE
jgi:hypothetical protein